ncbi:MAG: PLP-dependent transferase [Lachnospiraceae bacterium]|nr:PLP-dependent transferase [Lachnospiraceae bacterium]
MNDDQKCGEENQIIVNCKSPIKDFVENYASSNFVRLHMPGHKGEYGYKEDITEISGAASLYEEEGIIQESEKNVSVIFGTRRSFYGTEGSSQMIKAMCYMALIYSNGMKESVSRYKSTIIASRNAHRAFIHASMLLGFDIAWLPSEAEDYKLCRCKVTPQGLASYMEKYKESHRDQEIVGVFVTSPDYLGNILDIKGLAQVAHKFGTLLMVDNAHGAYFKFMNEDMHPISLGADMCADSAHKTLPVLTGGAYMHISENAPLGLENMAKNAMLLFGSTSPSFMILKSLDEANLRIDVEKYRDAAACIDLLKKRLVEEECFKKYCMGIAGDEMLKLTLDFSNTSISTRWFADKLKKYGFEPEYVDVDFIVTMWTPYMDYVQVADSFYKAVGKILSTDLDEENAIDKSNVVKRFVDRNPGLRLSTKIPEVVYKPYETMFMPRYKAKVEPDILGKIAASSVLQCPPAISPVVAGERISEDVLRTLRYYGIEYIELVAEN